MRALKSVTCFFLCFGVIGRVKAQSRILAAGPAELTPAWSRFFAMESLPNSTGTFAPAVHWGKSTCQPGRFLDQPFTLCRGGQPENPNELFRMFFLSLGTVWGNTQSLQKGLMASASSVQIHHKMRVYPVEQRVPGVSCCSCACLELNLPLGLAGTASCPICPWCSSSDTSEKTKACTYFDRSRSCQD